MKQMYGTSQYNYEQKQAEPSIGNIIMTIGLVQLAINDEIKKHGELSKYSQIGKIITIKDNSYNKCIDTNKGEWLIGNKLVIMSEIYQKQVYEGYELREFGERWCNMVKAFNPSNGKMYEVNFQEGWIED